MTTDDLTHDERCALSNSICGDPVAVRLLEGKRLVRDIEAKPDYPGVLFYTLTDEGERLHRENFVTPVSEGSGELTPDEREAAKWVWDVSLGRDLTFDEAEREAVAVHGAGVVGAYKRKVEAAKARGEDLVTFVFGGRPEPESPKRPPPHPDQPLVMAGDVVRFRKNPIVEFLLDAGPFDMNALARMPWEPEDRQQLAQLVGYSVSGYGSLSYVSAESRDRNDERAQALSFGREFAAENPESMRALAESEKRDVVVRWRRCEDGLPDSYRDVAFVVADPQDGMPLYHAMNVGYYSDADETWFADWGPVTGPLVVTHWCPREDLLPKP